MNRKQMTVYSHLLVKPPMTEEGERCACCEQHRAFWHGVDNPSASVKDFYTPSTLASGAFQAGQDFTRNHRSRQLKKR